MSTQRRVMTNRNEHPLPITQLRYRIRVGKAQFADPHYLVASGRHPRYTSIMINKNPLSWKNLAKAEAHLAEITDRFTTAEIEPYQANSDPK